MIAANVEPLRPRSVRRAVHGIAVSHWGRFRGRQYRLCEVSHSRIDHACRNLITRKRIAHEAARLRRIGARRVGIENLLWPVAQIAIEVRRGRHADVAERGRMRPVLLITEKEKGPVLAVVKLRQPNGRSHNSAECMSLEGVHHRVECVPRIEGIILHNLPNLASKFVRAGFGGSVDGATHHAAKLRRVVMRLHLELLNRLHNRVQGEVTKEGGLVGRAVQHVHAAAVHLSIHGRNTGLASGNRSNPRRHAHQVLNVAAAR